MLLTSATRFIFAGVLPLLGGLYLLAIGYALIVPSSLPLGQSPDWGTSLPIIITVLLGIPLVILAAMTARSDFFHEKTVSYVLVNGKLCRFPVRRHHGACRRGGRGGAQHARSDGRSGCRCGGSEPIE